MNVPSQVVLLVQLLEKQSPNLTEVEIALSRIAPQSLAIDSFSSLEMVQWGKQYLSADHNVILVLHKEPNGTWGKAQSLLREAAKAPGRVQLLTNFEEPMVLKLASVVARSYHYFNEKELLEQLKNLAL